MRKRGSLQMAMHACVVTLCLVGGSVCRHLGLPRAIASEVKDASMDEMGLATHAVIIVVINGILDVD